MVEINYCCKEDNTFIRHVMSKGNEKVEKYVYNDPFVINSFKFYDWQQEINNIIEGSICPRTIYNFYGKYNCGKTDFLKHMIMKFGTVHLLEGEKRHILEEVSKTYKTCNTYLWSFAGDEIPNSEFFQTIEKVKDMFFTAHFGTSKTERMVVGNRPHVIIISNFKIDLMNSKIDKDRFVFREIDLM